MPLDDPATRPSARVRSALDPVAGAPPDELRRLRQLAQRLVEDDGIEVGVDAAGRPRHLRLDPIPLVIGAPQWAALERGLAQRARLLDLLLTDLYGERSLISDGVLPPEPILGHPGFFLAADGVPTRSQLFLTAADLGVAADGSWRVVADRTQSPIGVGYAMAIRRITARALASAHRELNLRRLRGFFDVMRAGLQELATGTVELPRIVMLTAPEPGEPTFDEVFTATLLGFPVVRAEELSMRAGRVWVQTTERPEPVDVIVRRVDAARSDPLDLTTGSGSGVPGLLEACRRGIVTVVNPIGSGVLENPALAAFLPAISRRLLDEELLLPSARTWWCGSPDDLRYVASHFEELLLAPASAALSRRVFVANLSRDQRDQLWARVSAQPWAWSAQEVLPMWQADLATDTGLTPGTGVLRTFTLGTAQGTTVLPGGLARLTLQGRGEHFPPLQHAVAKDVWVLADETQPAWPAPAADRAARAVTGSDRSLASAAGRRFAVPVAARAAENLYWFGRYAERAESTARLLLVTENLVDDHLARTGSPGHAAMRIMLDGIDSITSGRRDRSWGATAADRVWAPSADPLQRLRTLAFDGGSRGTLRYCVQRAAAAAGQVRELLSSDTWLVFGRLDRTLTSGVADGEEFQSVLAQICEACLALAGIGAENLVRDASWAFFDAGRRVERAQETVRLLQRSVVVVDPFHERGAEPPPWELESVALESVVLESVLRARDSLISHRRRTAESRPLRSALELGLELLLVDPTNPRSVLFQLHRLRDDLGHAPAHNVDDTVVAATRVLAEAQVPALAADLDRLSAFCQELEVALRRVSSVIEATHFGHRATRRTIEVQR